jgi:acetoin utilization deacetylase AcuC-like enzyme
MPRPQPHIRRMNPGSASGERLTLFFTDTFAFPLPEGHRFPLHKYRLLRQAIERADIAARVQLEIPAPANDEQLLRVHSPEYLEKVKAGSLNPAEIRRIGLPWSAELVERSRRSVGGTIGACRAALATGLAMSLAGGTHHAHAAFGSGFCVFNDVAVAVREIQASALAERILIVDCDVHQGDGTAEIFAGDPSVITFSIHGERNFPFRKAASDLDLGLPDGTGDEDYMAALASTLEALFISTTPDLAIYLAGADPFQDDLLGRMNLSKAGLAARDALVLSACSARSIPLAITLAGGYARQILDVVEIHLQTVRLALESFEKLRGATSRGQTVDVG